MSFNTQPRRRVTLDCDPELGLTEQSHKDRCDIGKIVRQYARDGFWNHVNPSQGAFTDLPTDLDFHSAMCMITKVQQDFDNLPAQLRQDMDNDPRTFLAFLTNPNNKERMEEYGFDSSHLPVQPPAPETPPQPPVAPAAPTPPPAAE